MINVECDDDFLKKNIISLIKQKGSFLKSDYSNKFFFHLKFYQEDNFLLCISEEEKLNLIY